jgi:glycine/D-amino acid oxidase-like deaminating enzyme
MSWGCAEAVRQMVAAELLSNRLIAILGAGVMGLTAAVLLRKAGYRVTIYAEKYVETTSDVAGG